MGGIGIYDVNTVVLITASDKSLCILSDTNPYIISIQNMYIQCIHIHLLI